MRLDHVNIRTHRLDEMRRWYTEIVGLEEGWRPPFDFPGAWLYAGDQAVVHLIAVEAPAEVPAAPALEHFAFDVGGIGELSQLRARLEAAGIEALERRVPGTDILQVNLHDPDGIHLHLDFRIG